MAKISEIEITKLLFDEGAAPSTPASTNVAIYAKADGLLYSKDDAGAETLVSGGAGSSDPAWTAYTPTWTGETTNPALGNGTITGFFITTGKTHKFSIHLTTGTTTTYGTGRYNFTMGGSVSTAGMGTQAVQFYMFDSSTATPYGGPAWVNVSATPVVRPTVSGSGTINGISGTVPITIATADQLVITGIIQIA